MGQIRRPTDYPSDRHSETLIRRKKLDRIPQAEVSIFMLSPFSCQQCHLTAEHAEDQVHQLAVDEKRLIEAPDIKRQIDDHDSGQRQRHHN